MNDSTNIHPIGDPDPERDDLLVGAVTAALQFRVGANDVAADAWRRLEEGRATGGAGIGRQWSRAIVPVVAVAAATALLIGVGAALRPPTTIETTVPATRPPASSTVLPDPDPDVDPVVTGTTTVTTVPGAPTTSPSTSTSTPGRAGSWSDVDLSGLTLPTDACAGYRMPGETFTLVGGKAGSPGDNLANPRGPGVGVELLAPAVFGDLDGDGRDEAVIRLHCYLSNSDGLTNTVVVLRLVDGIPAVTALLPDSGTGAVIDSPFVADDRSPVTVASNRAQYDTATEIAIENGLLRIRWMQYDLGFPGDTATVRYRIAGGQATIVGQPERVPNPFHDPYDIRRVDLRSMTLPLAQRGVCASFFDPLGPLADAHLQAGNAQVTAADGRPLDASISLTDIRFGDAATLEPAVEDGQRMDWNEEALLLVTCRQGTDAFVAPVVVALTDGRPRVLADLGWFQITAGASATEIKMDQGLRVTWSQGTIMHFRWTGTAFEVERWS